MKKIFFTFFVLIILSVTQHSYAADCPIEGGPPKSIETYVKDLRKVIGNITSEALKQEGTFPIGDKLLAGMSSIISWQDYSTEFDFYITEPIFNDIPNQIRRDDKMFSREILNIERYLGQISKKGLYEAKITNPCTGVDGEKCMLKEGRAGNLIVQLLDNTKKIKNSIQYSTIGKGIYETDSLILTNQDLVKDIKITYKTSKILCSHSDGGFFKEIKKKITEISTNNKLAVEGINEWEKAWRILTGLSDNESSSLEKELLKKELSRQSVSGDQAEMILANLNNYNNKGGYSLENNPITNTYNSITNSISKEWNSFSKSISDGFTDNPKEKVSIQSLIKNEDKIDNTFSIKTDIQDLYEKQLPLSQIQDLNNTKLLGKIIDIHSSLGVNINLLEKTIPVSQKVCNDQAEAKGKCEY